MRRFVVSAILVCLGCHAWISGAAAQSEEDAGALFSAGSEAFERGDYRLAVAEFEAARTAGMPGPAVRYNIGVSRYKLGEYGRAEAEFRALAADFPAMRALAQYNLGLTLMKLDRVAEARAAFALARRSDDETIAHLADAMLARVSAPDSTPAAEGGSAPSDWIRLIDFSLGYDDNVALIDEASLPAGRSSGSPMVEAYGLISGPAGAAVNLRLDASAYAVRYSDAGEFDQNALQLGFAYLWRWQDWWFDAGPHYDYGTLAGSGFERRLGASLNARYPLGDSALLLFRFTHDDVQDLDPQFDFIGGTRERISVRYQQRHRRGRLAFGYVLEQNDRAGAGVSPERHEVFAGYEQALSAEWSVEVQGMMRASRYDELLVQRDEDLSQLSLTATREFASGWQLLGQYRIADNSSDAEPFDYDRHRFVLGLNRLF